MDIIFQLLAGFVLLLVGAEVLVRGASRLAAAIGMSQLVIGLTVVALGTSAPEFAVSLQSALSGSVDLAIGNAVGSNILNTLLILGISALVIPLAVSKDVMRVDFPVMLIATAGLYYLAMDGVLSLIDGLILFSTMVAYLTWLVWCSERRRRKRKRDDARAINAAGEIQAETPKTLLSVVFNLVLVVVGLGLLIYGCDLFVDACVKTARTLGVSELMIGLTIVSLGTSLPELLTCLVAALRGHRDIAVGNVVGSNLFNILGVLGLTAIVANNGLPVAAAAISFDIPVAIGAVLLCIPVFITGWKISRKEGALMVACYAAYIIYLISAHSGQA